MYHIFCQIINGSPWNRKYVEGLSTKFLSCSFKWDYMCLFTQLFRLSLNSLHLNNLIYPTIINKRMYLIFVILLLMDARAQGYKKLTFTHKYVIKAKILQPISNWKLSIKKFAISEKANCCQNYKCNK